MSVTKKLTLLVRQKGAKQAETQMTKLGASVKATIGGYVGMGIAAAAMFKALKDTTGAAISQEKIFRKLRTAVELTGKNYKSVEGNLKAFLAQLQATTEYGDTDSAQGLSMLIRLTGDYNKSVKALPLVLDLVSSEMFDMNTAARNVAMTLVGNIELMARYIPELKSSVTPFLATASAAEKAAFGLKLLNEKFGGAAQQNAEDFAGGLSKIKNAFSDVQEAAGDLIIELARSEDGKSWIVEQLQDIEKLLKDGDLLGLLAKVAPQFGGVFFVWARDMVSNMVAGADQGLSGVQSHVDDYIAKLINAKKAALDLLDVQSRKSGEVYGGGIGVDESLYQAFADLTREEAENKKQLAEWQLRYNLSLIDQSRIQSEIVVPAIERAQAANRELKEVWSSVAKSTEQAKEPVLEYANFVQDAANQMASAWSQALLSQWNEGQNFFENMTRGFQQMLASMVAELAAKAAIFAIFKYLVPGELLGGSLTSFLGFGGAKAGGGPVSSGQTYLVGEQGPELFTPKESGDIISNTTLNFNGAITDRNYVQRVIIPEIQRAQRLGG